VCRCEPDRADVAAAGDAIDNAGADSMPAVIVVTGRVQVPPEHRERFLEVATEMCRQSRTESGCEGYRVYADLEQADRYVFLEEWGDDAALQRHFGQRHTSAFMTDLADLLGEPAEALFHTTAVSRRLDPGRGLVPVD
jgi:quinol monooxygenase YgiN